MIEREKDIEAKLVQMVRAHGGLCPKWVCPGWAGVPDRIILLPGGRVIFAELKRPKGGTVAARQRWWGRKLMELGFAHFVVYNRHDIDTLQRWIRAAQKANEEDGTD